MTVDKIQDAWRRHEREFGDNRFVYAVVSRRSRGISIGINLNPDKICNFDCVYCQVNRKFSPAIPKVDLELLENELESVLEAERSGSLYEKEPFSVLAPEDRGVRDIAFSGNGEPTTFPRFREAVRIAAKARQSFGLSSVKLVLLTNATCLDKPSVRAALVALDHNNGEIWAKLDAGTEKYFRMVSRSAVPFQRILDNLLDASRARPIIIQSLWLRNSGAPPPLEEIEAYCKRLNDLLSAGGKLKGIQLYTIARNPVETSVSPLSRDELDRVAETVRSRVLTITEIFYGL
jgi:wyosine [tRNA(Phe)-imidazoG37] synthetase (radical SAM superfamily)